MKKNKPFLSIIVPVYNEKKRLNNLRTIHTYLKNKKFTSELVVVNDGSTDQTHSLLKKLSKEFPFTIVSYKENKGKGFAVKTGMLTAKGNNRLFTDIDLSTPIETCDIFIKKFDKYQVIVGTRKHKKANVVIHQPKLREQMGKTYTVLVNKILQLHVSDFTCGFKYFSEEAADQIFSNVTTNRWSFDAEVVFLAHHLGYKTTEIPLEWSNESDTKVKLPRDAILSFMELMKIRINIIKGVYSKKSKHSSKVSDTS